MRRGARCRKRPGAGDGDRHRFARRCARRLRAASHRYRRRRQAADRSVARPMTRWRDRFDALHEDAVAATGHEDFGDGAYRAGMRVPLDALDDNPPAGPATEAAPTGVIPGALAGRPVTPAGWPAHPGYAAERIARPLRPEKRP